jgi:hypothetical protein
MINPKVKNTLIAVVSISAIVFSLWLIKKNTYDDGLGTKDEEREELLDRYLIMKGIPDTKRNRNRYKSMTTEQLKKELGFDTEVIE